MQSGLAGSSEPERAAGRLEQSYHRWLGSCRSENDVNRVHLNLANRLTPAEVARLSGGIPRLRRLSGLYAGVIGLWNVYFPSVPGTMQREWQARMTDWLARSQKAAPEPFRRYRVGPCMSFFTAGGNVDAKSLLVCFTDRADRLFLPISVFLQHLSAKRHDVLLLRDPSRAGYAEGIIGVQGGLDGLLRQVAAVAESGCYSTVSSFGASAGGLIALLMATQLNFAKGVSVSGAGLDSRMKWARHLTSELERAVSSSPAANLLAIFSLDVDHDRQAGMSFERLGSVKTLAVTSRRRSVGHNPLFPILLERKLSAFLEKAVDPGGSGFTDGEGRHTRVYMTRDAKPPLLFRPPGRIRQNLDKLAKRLRSHNRARRN